MFDVCSADNKRTIAWLMQGIAFLAPYNAIIGALDYFQSLYGNSIMYLLAVPLTLPSIIFLLWSTFYGLCLPPLVLILFGYGLLCLSLILFCVCPVSLVGCLLIALLCGFGTAMTQGSLFSVVMKYESRLNAFFNLGIATSGFFICVLRLITKILVNNLLLSAYIYFAVAIFLVIISSWLFIQWQEKNPYVGDLSEVIPLKSKEQANVTTVNSIPDEEEQFIPDMSVGQIMKTIIVPISSVFLTFCITLSLFPGVCSEFVSNLDVLQNGWFAIIQITLFGFGDLLSRFCLTRSWFPKLKKTQLLILSIVRLAFLPWFIFMIHPKLLISDVWAYVGVILLSFSNGYVGTLSMMLAPGLVQTDEQKSRVGIIMSFWLTFGLVCGSWLGILVKVIMDNYLVEIK